MKGKIDRLYPEKGFGFIAAEDGKRYFFHRNAVKNARLEELTVGDTVTVEDYDEGPKGLRTERVFVQ